MRVLIARVVAACARPSSRAVAAVANAPDLNPADHGISGATDPSCPANQVDCLRQNSGGRGVHAPTRRGIKKLYIQETTGAAAGAAASAATGATGAAAPVLSPPVTVTKLLLPQRAEASVASSHGASRMPSSCKHVCSRTRSVVSVQEQGRHHRCAWLARAKIFRVCCRQSGVHRHHIRGHLQPPPVAKGLHRLVLEAGPSPGKRG